MSGEEGLPGAALAVLRLGGDSQSWGPALKRLPSLWPRSVPQRKVGQGLACLPRCISSWGGGREAARGIQLSRPR